MYHWRFFLPQQLACFAPFVFVIPPSSSARQNPNPSNLNWVTPVPRLKLWGEDGAEAARGHQLYWCLGEAAAPALPFSLHLALLRTFTVFYPSMSLRT